VKGGRGEPTLNGVFVGHLQFEAPGRTIGTVTVSCGIGRCRARMGPGNAVRGSNYQAAQGAVQGSSAAIVDDEFEAPTAAVAGDDKKASRMRRARTANA
jgi:hypothetical protein